MLGLVGLMALAVGGAVFLFSSRAAPRPAPPEVVQVEPQQPQMRPVPQPMQVQQPPPRNPPVIPPGPFAGNPQPQPQPPPQAKTSYTQLVGTWQVINPVSGYPTRLVFHPDLTGDQTFDSGNGTARTNPFTTTVGAAGDTSLGVQLHVNMGMYGYSFEFLGPDRVRLGAGGQAPEYARVK
jgi:hypothetical protein